MHKIKQQMASVEVHQTNVRCLDLCGFTKALEQGERGDVVALRVMERVSGEIISYLSLIPVTASDEAASPVLAAIPSKTYHDLVC